MQGLRLDPVHLVGLETQGRCAGERTMKPFPVHLVSHKHQTVCTINNTKHFTFNCVAVTTETVSGAVVHHCLDQTVGWLQGRKYLCSRKAVKSNVVLSLCVRGRNSPWMENCCRSAKFCTHPTNISAPARKLLKS